jgi:hypothetical protein
VGLELKARNASAFIKTKEGITKYASGFTRNKRLAEKTAYNSPNGGTLQKVKVPIHKTKNVSKRGTPRRRQEYWVEHDAFENGLLEETPYE